MTISRARTDSSGLSFRRFTPADIPAVHEYCSDPEVVRWSTWGPNTLVQTTAFVEDAARPLPQADLSAFTLAAVLNGTAIGSVSIWTTDPHDRNGELGYTLHRAHWGRGYATEAVSQLLGLGFGPLGLERITATCHPGNIGSIRVLQKSGFTQEGVLRSHRLVHGTRRDSLLFSILRDDPHSEAVAGSTR
ncbi:GNAT family N-acetyltransferase [Arthrobacter sp. LAPM80]|uniref:GNAT family N-acetyltransferase n=1 Tax=Arthrobacter sp. LAPM80 TaxID=3141788 RepID=UPI00398A8730